jgi:hypothetical protein
MVTLTCPQYVPPSTLVQSVEFERVGWIKVVGAGGWKPSALCCHRYGVIIAQGINKVLANEIKKCMTKSLDIRVSIF